MVKDLTVGQPSKILWRFTLPLFISVMFQQFYSVMDTMNPNLEEAASDLGASKLKAFFHVVLPSLIPGILSGAQLAFTLSLDDVVISYFTAGPESNTLPLQVFSMIKTGVTPDVNAMITIMLLIIFATLFVSMSLNLRRIGKEARI